ncbi:methyltransferase domain-containing protein [Methylobacterium sp. BTF04]|uniref:class I SAM-dependent methyltransferase n=1 Tax=Methylobacterium sp. BTF04 TaxID=2708300 RepID=UPI0013D22D6A|nr:class I SAM-dependent methyltransferase [Methylobacterium sp. BTF04]NEU14901.1 methyltransferase domain-containing protein [Methylobacterium sp. BTF04]
MDLDYATEQAAKLYSLSEDIHGALPRSTSYWTDKYVSRIMSSLWGAPDVEAFYAKCIIDLCQEHPEKKLRAVSLGCGDAFIELEVYKRVIESGCHNIRFDCVDVAEGAVARGKQRAVEMSISTDFDLRVDIYESLFDKPADVVIANQVLHHIVDLEGLFSSISRAIGTHGIFISADMIGRNGHMLWPEALAILDPLWQQLPDKFKYNHCLRRLESQYSNWDNSKEANEGIRAQDILPCLIDNFGFEKFFAAGNLAVAIFGRHFGYNFNPEVDQERDLIDRISDTDYNLIDFGYLKPTLMYACMSNRGRSTQIYRHWSPEFCARRNDPAAGHYAIKRFGKDEAVEFSERLPAIECLREGWSSPEVGGVWSNASHSSVSVPLNGIYNGGALKLQIYGMQYQPDGVENIPITISVNGKEFRDVRFPGHQIGAAWIELPLNGVDDFETLAVHFEYPKTWSALELGLADDTRQLALRLIFFALRDNHEQKPGQIS